LDAPTSECEEGTLALDLIIAAFSAWIAAALLALIGRGLALCRLLLGAGCLAAGLAALITLPGSIPPTAIGMSVAGHAVWLRFDAGALWLLGFGMASAMLACWVGSPASGTRRGWLFGCAASGRSFRAGGSAGRLFGAG